MFLWESFKAWRRGEKRVKGTTRGRCFVRKNVTDTEDGTLDDGVKRAKSEPTLKLKMKVTRADGSVEEYEENG